MNDTTSELAIGADATGRINKAAKAEGNLAHLKRLADVMAPEPREWTYEGEVSDAGMLGAHCSCGHPIRYVFTIRHRASGRSAPIGSTCIETSVPFLMAHGAADLAERLKAAVEKLKAEIAAAQKAKRDAEANERVQRLLADHGRIAGFVRGKKERGEFISNYALWKFAYGPKPKALTTPGRTATSLLRKLAEIVAIAATELPHLDLSPEVVEAAGKVILTRAQYRPELTNEAKDALTALYGDPRDVLEVEEGAAPAA